MLVWLLRKPRPNWKGRSAIGGGGGGGGGGEGEEGEEGEEEEEEEEDDDDDDDLTVTCIYSVVCEFRSSI